MTYWEALYMNQDITTFNTNEVRRKSWKNNHWVKLSDYGGIIHCWFIKPDDNETVNYKLNVTAEIELMSDDWEIR